MSRLFIELYLDEDVRVLIADLLHSRGFVATTTQEAGNLGCTDERQLKYATNQRKTLLTHNRADFEVLVQKYFSAERPHPGIVIAVRRPPIEIARRLLAILNSVTSDEMENQIRYI